MTTISATGFHLVDSIATLGISSMGSNYFSENWARVGNGNQRMRLVDSPARIPGQKSIRASVDPAIDAIGDAGRCEMLARASPNLPAELRNQNNILKHMNGATYWYAFSVFVPNTTLSDPKDPEVLFQCHSFTTNLNPPFSLRVLGDKWYMYIATSAEAPGAGHAGVKKTNVLLGPVIKNVWTDWAFKIKWSHAADGLIEAYQNGVLAKTYAGGNNYNVPTGHHMKTGVYKSAWNSIATVPAHHDRTYYIANWVIGGDGLTLADVSPPRIHAKTSISVWTETRDLLRLISAATGESMMDAAQRVVAAEWEQQQAEVPEV